MSTPNMLTNDWFISAIVNDGTVSQCLNMVVTELDRKQRFVQKLKEKIGEKSGGNIDAITEISARILTLENTLKFRLSILSPDRRGAWFRTSASTATGPFAGTVLPDAVFSNYDENRTNKIRAGLVDCWNKRNLLSYPFKASESCLWKILLSINFELHSIGDLGEWARLEALPEELAGDFESRALKAFLSNVKMEYLAARQRLVNAYDVLLDASDRFWAGARSFKSSSGDASGKSGAHEDMYDGHRAAEKMRQDFRSRRSSTTIKRPVGKSAQDIEALVFMGFEDFPDSESLKQRYHSLALEMHPDRQGGNEARFKLLAKSYKHLAMFCAHHP